MLRAANETKRNNYLLFVGDSRIREQYNEFINCFGVPGSSGTNLRKQNDLSAMIPRLRQRIVSIQMFRYVIHLSNVACVA